MNTNNTLIIFSLLCYVLVLLLARIATASELPMEILIHTSHTPPEGGVRTKKCYITFDTICGRYLPRGTLIDGSQKCRMGAFSTIAKYLGEMSKYWPKMGKMWPIFFLALTYAK